MTSFAKMRSNRSAPNTALACFGALGAVAALFAATFAPTTASAAISSNVYIEAQETFVLGGAQPGAFDVHGTNRGDVAVEVYVRENGKDTLVSTVAPGDRFDAGFEQGEGALLKNTSGTARAHMKVRVTGTTRNLGMGYEGW